MKNWKKICSRLLAALLCLAVCGIVSVGVAQARYSKLISQKDIPMQVRKNTLQVEVGDWETRADGSYQVMITVSNTGTKPIQYSVSCLASLGLGSAGNAAVTMDGYSSVSEAIVEGSMLYSSFGDGWIFRFRNEEGAEPVWELSASDTQTKILKVTPVPGIQLDSSVMFRVQVDQQS